MKSFRYDKWAFILGTFLTVIGIIFEVTNDEIRDMAGLKRETQSCPLLVPGNQPPTTIGYLGKNLIIHPDGTWYEEVSDLAIAFPKILNLVPQSSALQSQEIGIEDI